MKNCFDRAVNTCGNLLADEMSGFEPALVCSGEITIENVRKLKIQPHLHMLREFATPAFPRYAIDVNRWPGSDPKSNHVEPSPCSAAFLIRRRDPGSIEPSMARLYRCLAAVPAAGRHPVISPGFGQIQSLLPSRSRSRFHSPHLHGASRRWPDRSTARGQSASPLPRCHRTRSPCRRAARSPCPRRHRDAATPRLRHWRC